MWLIMRRSIVSGAAPPAASAPRNCSSRGSSVRFHATGGPPSITISRGSDGVP
jgi:hypothetical protein